MNRTTSRSINVQMNRHMAALKKYCESFPDCKGCPKLKEHTGCEFRKGRTPREWEV